MPSTLQSSLVGLKEGYLPHLSYPELSLILAGLLFLCLFAVCYLLLHLLKKGREKDRLTVLYQALSEEHTRLKLEQAGLSASLAAERESAREKLQLLELARDELRLQFKALAATIFEEKSAKLTSLNQAGLTDILEPFRNELDSLKKEINTIYLSETRERASLKTEILQLRELNHRLNTEATNLTRALQGDSRTRGNWGELILERVLEASGLRKGHEYLVQSSYRDERQRLYRPDVVVLLPGKKELVIDSKMSLVAWQRYITCERADEQKSHLKDHCRAITEHIKELSGKNYQNLAQLSCLDFVLMFIPIEAAFAEALEADRTLLDRALKKNIILVTPTTLLATLRTVQNLWQYQRQNKNAAEIARRASSLYDKFRGFIEDLLKIGSQLDALGTSYEAALAKLSRGKGNLVSQAEQLKELGVQVKKEFPRSIAGNSDDYSDN